MKKLKSPNHVVIDYLRKDKKFPHIFCPGCGHGTILGSLIRAIDKSGIDKDSISMVSGIGCSSRAPVYVDFNTMHTLHGRAIAFATGMKLANPSQKVIVITGDGDATAIGGNHFIHACRRNIDMTVIVFNNNIYGMTGGQYSPTTPVGAKASTAQYGNIERPFDVCDLAVGAGASFVARGTSFNPRSLINILSAALDKKGLSIVEVISQCPTAYGRKNNFKSTIEMLDWQKENAIDIRAWDKLPKEKTEGKFKVGIFTNKDLPEYIEEYEKIHNASKNGGTAK